VLGETSAETAGCAERRGQVLLSVRDLSVDYAGAVPALRDVSMDVADGRILAVLGSNGAGKTTLLRAISGTLAGQRGSIVGGEIAFAGRSLRGLDAATIARAGVVQVPEARRIFGRLTVAENLRAGGLAARDKAARARALAWVHDLFPVLAERGRQRAGLLSGGEQQMLAIGRALMAAPRVLLLDEPSLGLAPRIVDQIAGVIEDINRSGVSVVLVEQNAAMALAVADDAVVLEVGRVSLARPASELADSPEVRDRYLGVDVSAGQARPAPAPATGVGELVVDGLTVRFGGITALADVSFTVKPGTMHALIGPNGAGKSTCLNVLSGVYAADAGSVRYGGRELRGLRPHRVAALGVSRTFQNISLSASAPVLDNLLLARHRLMRAGFVSDALRLPRARREHAHHQARVREIAGLLDLSPVLAQPVRTLSYGTRKRVELARSLCAEPGLLLLDEPVAGMTHEESAAMASAIASARAELGISAVVVEHDMAFVMGIADHVTVLDFGRRIADGTPAEIQRSADVRRAYLGGDT
jgi:ABC-type branched-subunit amino acid transport system ATPase component